MIWEWLPPALRTQYPVGQWIEAPVGGFLYFKHRVWAEEFWFANPCPDTELWGIHVIDPFPVADIVAVGSLDTHIVVKFWETWQRNAYTMLAPCGTFASRIIRLAKKLDVPS